MSIDWDRNKINRRLKRESIEKTIEDSINEEKYNITERPFRETMLLMVTSVEGGEFFVDEDLLTMEIKSHFPYGIKTARKISKQMREKIENGHKDYDWLRKELQNGID